MAVRSPHVAVTWVRNQLDHRIAYTRYCLMDAHRRGALVYDEIGVDEATRMFDLTDLQLGRLSQGISLFVAVTPAATKRFVVDNSDGFLHLSPLLRDVDVYFAGPYLPDLHRRGVVPAFDDVENQDAVGQYREISARILREFDGVLERVRPYIPMQFRMQRAGSGLLDAPLRRAEHVLQRRRFHVGARALVHRAHESRYREVMELRSCGLEWDVVARDSLWGTKNERLMLHEVLAALPATAKVFAELGGASAAGGGAPSVEPSQRRFEAMLASSRLCTLARGKHLGWREVGFLALALGLPTVMPRPVYEPYVPLDAPGISYTDGRWQEVPQLLADLDDAEWSSLRQRGQNWFDERFAPSRVADYILRVLAETVSR